jgi:hypothetical protein
VGLLGEITVTLCFFFGGTFAGGFSFLLFFAETGFAFEAFGFDVFFFAFRLFRPGLL